jgi:hypothetical protein
MKLASPRSNRGCWGCRSVVGLLLLAGNDGNRLDYSAPQPFVNSRLEAPGDSCFNLRVKMQRAGGEIHYFSRTRSWRKKMRFRAHGFDSLLLSTSMISLNSHKEPRGGYGPSQKVLANSVPIQLLNEGEKAGWHDVPGCQKVV